MTGSNVPLAGVLGSPISHSKSPTLHGYWLRKYGIRGHYIPMNVTATDLSDAIATLPKLGFRGVNVTIPHKERVLQLADVVSDRAAIIGAANTIVFGGDGKVYADNTDGYGFIENICQSIPDWDPKSGPCAVIGAGGAARAVINALIDKGAEEIRLTNRTRTRAEALRQEFGKKIHVYDWVQAGNMFEEASTVVNTSSLGMTGYPEIRIPLDGLSSGTVVTDIVYTPLETRLLAQAKAVGCRTVDGLGMLLHQAVPGFERWFGVRPEVTDELRQAVLT